MQHTFSLNIILNLLTSVLKWVGGVPGPQYAFLSNSGGEGTKHIIYNSKPKPDINKNAAKSINRQQPI